MVDSLLNNASTLVRRHWSQLNTNTQNLVFDVLWRARVKELKQQYPASMAEVDLNTLYELCYNQTTTTAVSGLSSKQRYHLHTVCEALGLDHESVGDDNERVLQMSKRHPWNWEFTEGRKQPKKRRRGSNYFEEENKREEYIDACFQVYAKFNAHGYLSPSHMLDNEPHYAAILNEY